MKYAGKTFTLYASEPVAVQGSDSLYTYQNTGTGTATLQGSNNGKDWVTITTVTSGASSISSHSYAFLRMTGSTEVSVSRGEAGSGSTLLNGSAVSSSNPLPVAQTDGLAVSGTATSAAVLFTTSMLNYESITVQVTSAGTGCTITYETSDDNTNWVSIGGLNANAVGTLTTSTTSTAATMIQFSRKGLYFRARVSTYGSGTVTVIGTLSKVAVVNTLPAIYSVHTEGNTVSSGTFGITVEGRTSSKTSASNAQFVRPIATLDGRLITRLNSIPENEWQYAAASGGIVNTTTAVTLVSAQAAGVRNYLTSLQLSSDVLGAATEIAIRDGAGGTVLWRGKIGTAGIAGVSTIQFSDPLKSTAATLLEVVTLTASVTGGVYVNAQGYIAP